MHLYIPSPSELATITGASAEHVAPESQNVRAARLTRGAWCVGVAALKSSRGRWPNPMPIEIEDTARHGERSVLLTHRITAVDDTIYDVKSPVAFLASNPTDIPVFDVETLGRIPSDDGELIKIHAFRIGLTALQESVSGLTYPSIHHVSGNQENEIVGEEVLIGGADWAVALHSVMKITDRQSLAEV